MNSISITGRQPESGPIRFHSTGRRDDASDKMNGAADLAEAEALMRLDARQIGELCIACDFAETGCQSPVFNRVHKGSAYTPTTKGFAHVPAFEIGNRHGRCTLDMIVSERDLGKPDNFPGGILRDEDRAF